MDQKLLDGLKYWVEQSDGIIVSMPAEVVQAAYSVLSAQSAVQEPVGYIQRDHLQKARQAPHLCRVEPTQRCPDFDPIYTHPSSAAQVEEIRNAALDEANRACKQASLAAQTHRTNCDSEGDKVRANYWMGYSDGAAIAAHAIRALKTPAPYKGEGS